MSNDFSCTAIVFKHDGLGHADEALRHKLATNYLKTLLELGFQVAGPMAGTPDLRITGEAFSEPGARRGQLVSSRARVEVKVETADGKILAVDRQTATAVDTAEAIAGKTALEAAALDLIERLAPTISAK